MFVYRGIYTCDIRVYPVNKNAGLYTARIIIEAEFGGKKVTFPLRNLLVSSTKSALFLHEIARFLPIFGSEFCEIRIVLSACFSKNVEKVSVTKRHFSTENHLQKSLFCGEILTILEFVSFKFVEKMAEKEAFLWRK